MASHASWAVPNAESDSKSKDPSPAREIVERVLPECSERPENRDDDRSPLSEHRQAEYEKGTALQFLIIKTPSHSPDKKHRKAVRSHVMRTFHSHRRKQQTLPVRKRVIIQKGSDTSLKLPLPVAPNPAVGSSNYTGISDPNDLVRPSGRFSTVNEAVTSLLSASPTATEPSTVVLHNPGGGKITNEQASTLLNRAASERGGHGSADFANLLQSLSQFDRWLFDTTTPYALVQADGAPYFFLHCKAWPFPQKVGRLRPKISVWMPESFIPPPNMRNPRSCMHLSFRVLPYIHNCLEYFSFKIETIKWINSRIWKGDLGLSDTTLGSIMLLTDLELGRGNAAEAVAHMNAVERIVNLRGGIEAFANNRQTQLKITMLDLVTAVMGNQNPRFSLLRSPIPIMPPIRMMDTTILKSPDSPLYSHHPLSIILQGSEFCGQSIALLQHMQDLTMLALKVCSRRAMEPLDILHEEDLGTPYEPHHPAPSLLRIIHLASTIYNRALLTRPTRFSSAVNMSAAKELCCCLENPVQDAIWDHYPAILLWCLLTGAAATQNGMPEHGLFVSLTIKIGLGAGHGWWEEMSAAMVTFGKVKVRAEGRH